MKYKGKSTYGPRKMPAVFERHPENIVWWMKALDDYSEFNKLCPEPEPEKWVDPSDPSNVKYVKNEGFKKREIDRLLRWTYWLTYHSLMSCPENTEAGLEFETFDPGNPDTWETMEKELTEFGLTFGEKRYLFNLASKVNALTDEYLDEGLERFLASRRQTEKQDA